MEIAAGDGRDRMQSELVEHAVFVAGHDIHAPRPPVNLESFDFRPGREFGKDHVAPFGGGSHDPRHPPVSDAQHFTLGAVPDLGAVIDIAQRQVNGLAVYDQLQVMVMGVECEAPGFAARASEFPLGELSGRCEYGVVAER